jgi:hypothetical protein
MHDPPPHPLRTVATAVNPEAGTHTVTADPRELAAVERAGERSWSAWPYFARRYGERGRRFTRSDSAWIATLAELPAEAVSTQVRWLAGLLAARGMPRLLLEEHLLVLHQELVAAAPDRGDAYAVLQRGAEMLRAERQQHLSDPTLLMLEAAFHRWVPPEPPTNELRAGLLIGAAVADERAGLPRAVDSLLEWLADPTLFGQPWRTAVDSVLRQARGAPRAAGEEHRADSSSMASHEP